MIYGIHLSASLYQEPTETSKQPIRTRYLGHVTGYQPIRVQYFLLSTRQCSYHENQGNSPRQLRGSGGEDTQRNRHRTRGHRMVVFRCSERLGRRRCLALRLDPQRERNIENRERRREGYLVGIWFSSGTDRFRKHWSLIG
eukprot:sb/3474199/